VGREYGNDNDKKRGNLKEKGRIRKDKKMCQRKVSILSNQFYLNSGLSTMIF
jgi:hypothetical protein